MPRTRESTAYAQRLMREYNHARKLLRTYLKKRHESSDVTAMIEAVIKDMTAKQSKIIGYTLNTAFETGAKEGNKILSKARITAAAATLGFDMSKVADTHLNKITGNNIGNIGKFNKTLTNQLQLEYKTLLADNKLVNSLTKTGWTPAIEKAISKRGISAEVLTVMKGQTTTKKIVSLLETNGIRGGMNPRAVSRLLQPHVSNYFGSNGVLIDNVGKIKKVLRVDADGNFKYVKQAVTRPYRATAKTYSNLLARSSMIQAHHEGRYQSLEKTGLVDHYISVSVLSANTCDLCATMHGQRISHSEGPLYHPSGACDLKPIWKNDSGLSNKDSSFYENQRDQHFWKQHQLAEYNKGMSRGAKLKFHSMLPKDAIATMPGKDAMRTIRYNALGKPAVIKPTIPVTKPKVTPKVVPSKVVSKPTSVKPSPTKSAKPSKPAITKEKSVTIKTDRDGITAKLKPYGVDNLKLTGHEEMATSMYKGEGYKEINNALRGKIKPTSFSKTATKNVDSALSKSKVPDDITVFRGISPRQAKIIKDTNQCANKGYTSTTYNPNNAFTFTDRAEDGFFNLMELKVKKGTNALIWPGGENEVMLGRGLKLKCTGIKEVNNFAMKSSVKAADKAKKVRIFIMEAV